MRQIARRKYFEILIKLFDVYFNAGNVSESIRSFGEIGRHRILTITATRKRLQKLQGRVDDSLLSRPFSGSPDQVRNVGSASPRADAIFNGG